MNIRFKSVLRRRAKSALSRGRHKVPFSVLHDKRIELYEFVVITDGDRMLEARVVGCARSKDGYYLQCAAEAREVLNFLEE